ncbi:4'-phosphopantetheinyl transferase family protein [Neisseriaceae bacterium B1]
MQQPLLAADFLLFRIMELTCLFAGSDFAAHYNVEKLSAEDKIRLYHYPSLANRADWQISRALKQYAELPIISLSHSQHSAALLMGNTCIQAGIDIEYLRPRNFGMYREWILSDSEKELFSTNTMSMQTFYQIWTVKKALLKAENLSFPADMQHVGWQDYENLHVSGQTNWHGACMQIENFMLAVTWFDYPDLRFNIQTFGNWQHEEVLLLKRW